MASKEALDALDLRLAKGGITAAQYDELKQRLLSRDDGYDDDEDRDLPPSSDPVVVKILETMEERQDSLIGSAFIVAVGLGVVVVAGILVADHYWHFLSGLEKSITGWLPKRWAFVSRYVVPLVVPVGGAIAGGLVVALWVWSRSMANEFATPLPAETFKRLTPEQRTEIDERLDGVTLRQNRFEYDPEFGAFAFASGVGGLVAVLLYWAYQYFSK